MDKSTLYVSHLALRDLLFKQGIWNIYAYVPGDKMTAQPKWKIKTRRYMHGKFSFDSLKYYDNEEAKCYPLVFNFGWREREKVSGVGIKVVQLCYEYELEREILEKMCELSDAGHIITTNNQVIMDKFKGSEFLVKIDMEAPSYAYLDETALPF